MNRVIFDEGVMREFLANHDLIYEKPAEIWDECIPLGNSEVFASIWGKDRLNVTIQREDIWERRPYPTDSERWRWSYVTKCFEEGKYDDFAGAEQPCNPEAGPVPQQIPLGRFEVRLKGKRRLSFGMRLSLYDAIATGHQATELGGIEWSCYVPAEQPLAVFRYRVFGEEEEQIRFRFCSELDEYEEDFQELLARNPLRAKAAPLLKDFPRGQAPNVSRILRKWGYEDPERGEMDGICFYRQKVPEHGNYAAAWAILEEGDGCKTILVAPACDPRQGKAEEQAVSVVKRYLDRRERACAYAEHLRWWHRYYRSSFYSIRDTKLEGLYWANRYKLGCLTRPGAQAPAKSGGWQGDEGTMTFLGNLYVWNTQNCMLLFPLYTANQLEGLRSTFDMIFRNEDKMRDVCRRFYGIEGEFLPKFTDDELNGLSNSIDIFQLISGPWMCQMMWNYYRYSLDTAFLRDRLQPMMKQVCRLMMGLLERWEDGKLHLPWTESPEYPPQEGYEGIWGPDATCDIAYTRFLCETLLETERLLGAPDEDHVRWEETLRDLMQPGLDAYGGLKVRGDADYTISHRHMSHVFPITQLYQITCDTPEGQKIIDGSIRALKAAGFAEWSGWTFSEIAKLAILGRNPVMAMELLHDYSDKIVLPSTFDTNGSRYGGGFLFHGEGGCNGGLSLESDGMFNETLQCFAVRSYNGVIYVMDVLPEDLSDMSFWNFRAEGAFLISGQRRDGIIEWIQIESEQDGAVTLQSGLHTDVSVTCGGDPISYEIRGDRIHFQTRAGCRYLVRRTGSCCRDTVLRTVTPKPGERNAYGLKRFNTFRQ